MSTYTPPPQVFQAGYATVGELFASSVRSNPHHVAVVDAKRALSYAELDDRTNRLANHWRADGLTHGDRVAILATNCIEYVEVEIAAAKLGLVVAALNWRLGARELAHSVSLVEPSALVVAESLRAQLSELPVAELPTLGIGGNYEETLSAASSAPVLESFDAESGLVILYTSGTTGLPKGALISHRAMVARGMAYTSELNISRYSRFVAWAPMYHMASTDHLLAHLMRGGVVHVVDGYQPDELVDILEAHELDWFILMPGMVADFCRVLKARNAKPRGVDLIGAMPDLIPREEIAEVTTLLDAPFLNSFGATETGLAPATGSPIEIGSTSERLPKRQTAFCDVRLVDADDTEVPVGTPGEVSISGPTLFSGYWNNDATNLADFRGGRFHMGDVMRRNGDGTLEYVDRVKYMIKSGGENIYPAEIETVVTQDDRVTTAVVVRKPDERWGEVPVLFVVRRDTSLDEDTLLALCARDLSSYKRPKAIWFIDDAELPRSTTGKIQRHVLEERIANRAPTDMGPV
ncbi:MAG: class I adenylate-forming enzyme family protein [Gammaproteobacteria bacterium]